MKMKEDSASSPSTGASQILSQLVAHYHQSVHQDALKEEINLRYSYLEQKEDLKHILEASPMTRYLREKLVALPSSRALLEWIAGYATHIHPLMHLFPQTTSPFAVIQQYEYLLSECLDCCEKVSRHDELPPTEDRENRLVQVGLCVTKDIQQMYLRMQHEEASSNSNLVMILPLLLRLLQHIARLFPREKSTEDGGKSTTLAPSPFASSMTRDYSWTTTCFVTLLPLVFREAVNPSTLNPRLQLIGTRDWWKHFVYDGDGWLRESAADDDDDDGEASPDISSLTTHIIDWENEIKLQFLPDNNDSRGMIWRTAFATWKSLAQLLGSVDEKDDKKPIPTIDDHCLLQDCQVCFQALGAENVISTLLSFCEELSTDPLPTPDSLDINVHTFMGRRVTAQEQRIRRLKKQTNTKTDQWHPVALQAFLICIHLINSTRIHRDDDLWQCVSESLWGRVMDFCLELVDSIRPEYAALGASAVAGLLQGDSQREQIRLERMIDIFHSASQIHRQGPTGVAVAMAQYEVLKGLPPNHKCHLAAGRQWLSNLHRGGRTVNDIATWELLVGAIIPMFYSLSQLGNAKGMDLGRLGLTILLPILALEDATDDRKVHVAATLALVNLMVAAHPIIPHHGGKIMCHLLSLFSPQPSRQMEFIFQRASAFGLVLGGPRARQVVETIQTTNSNTGDKDAKYRASFYKTVSDIQELATIFQT